MIQAVEPWISSDIEKGARWGSEIRDKLEKSKVGIICLTKENLDQPWILFEAGALSRTKDAHVCTFLLDIEYTDVRQPLAQFQHTKFEKKDIRRLVHTINKLLERVDEHPLHEDVLNNAFNQFWPELEKELEEIAKGESEESSKPARTEREILEEILEILRAQESRSYIHESVEKVSGSMPP